MRYVILLIALAGFCLTLTGGAESKTTSGVHNIGEDGLGLQGYDPVSYFDGMPQKGESEFSSSYDGIIYRFTSADTLSRFKADPRSFVPAYGGWCAWAMLDGDKVEINPKRYKIVDGINYLFYDGFWGNTLEKWNGKATKETEKALIRIADEQWQKILAQ